MVVVTSFLASVLSPRLVRTLVLIGFVIAIAVTAWSMLGASVGTPHLAPTRWFPVHLG